MSIDTNIVGVKRIENQDEFNKMYKIAKKCYDNASEFPDNVIKYFENDEYMIDDYDFENKKDVEVKFGFVDIPDSAIEETDDEYGGHYIYLDKIPKNVNVIKVYRF